MGSIMIFGDICPDNNYRELFDSGRFGPFAGEIAEDINNATLVIGNLECPATDNTVPIAKCGPNLRAEPKDIDLLKRVGIDILSLANNHILDYGILSVDETIQKCHECGVQTVGAGANVAQAREPLIVDVDRKRIGIFSFAEAEFNLATDTAPGANHFDPYTSFDDIRSIKASVDYIIVLYHGGIEHYRLPSPLLQKKCRGFVSAGANLVLCQHSHCVGTFENINGATILYGQGNSVFGYRVGDSAWNEGLVVILDTKTWNVEYRVLEAKADGVYYAYREAATEKIKRVHDESGIISDKAEVQARWAEFCQSIASLDIPLLYGKNRVYIKLNRILHNWLINRFISRQKQRITMNLLRCEAHLEVVQTIFENQLLK